MDLRALSMLVEKPQSFEIEDRDGKMQTYHLYPLQLGRLALITERLIHLDLILDDPDTDVVKAMWEICSSEPKRVAEIIAIATLRTREDIETHLEERVQEFLWSPTMTPQALANILYTIIFQSYHEDFMKAIRLVKMEICKFVKNALFCTFAPYIKHLQRLALSYIVLLFHFFILTLFAI